MSKKPSVEALQTAADWLEYNEGEDGERENCHEVAEWIRRHIAQIEEKEEAESHGVSVAILRKAKSHLRKEAKRKDKP